MACFLWCFLDKVKTALILEEKLNLYNQNMNSKIRKRTTHLKYSVSHWDQISLPVVLFIAAMLR